MISASNTVFDIHFPSDTAPGVAPYSARGLKGKLSLSAAVTGSDNLRRTINGTLLNLTPPQMRKYVLEISGDDQAPPALDGVWPGMDVVVDSNVELAFLTGGGAGRTMVPGSERFEGDYTYYCMRLSMLVVEFDVERDEWAAEVGWSLTLEEV